MVKNGVKKDRLDKSDPYLKSLLVVTKVKKNVKTNYTSTISTVLRLKEKKKLKKELFITIGNINIQINYF